MEETSIGWPLLFRLVEHLVPAEGKTAPLSQAMQQSTLAKTLAHAVRLVLMSNGKRSGNGYPVQVTVGTRRWVDNTPLWWPSSWALLKTKMFRR